jgi:hypothetical protein
MDVASSIAGLIALTDLVFCRVFAYIKAVKNADREISTFSVEILTLSGILHSLHLVTCRLEDGDYDRSLRVHHVYYCHETLEKVKKRLQKAFPDGDENSRQKTLLNKLKWPFSAGETKDLVAEIQRHKATLTLALSADSLSSLLTALGRQEAIENGLRDIRQELRKRWDQETSAGLSSERKMALQFFCRVDAQSNHDMSLNLRHPGTGLWQASFQRNNEFD